MDAQNKQQKHSGLGIAAFILSLLSPIFCIAGVFTFFVMLSHAHTRSDQAIQAALNGWLGGVILWVLTPAGVLMLPLALLLGIVGLMQKDRKKTFALAATGMIVLDFIGLLLVQQKVL